MIATQPLLGVRNLFASYGEIDALRDVSLAIEPGGIVALLGANGAGKTTCLRAITGMVKRSGSVDFDGTSIAQHATEDIARLGIAHVPEGRGTLADLSVWENLALGAYLLGGARAQRRYERIVTYFPWIEQRRKQHAGTLSGGEQQMLAIARALMMEPKLMLLDEPSLGLAPRVVQEIFDLLRAINRDEKVTILLAEQNAAMAFATAAYVYVLETGRVAAEGPSEVLARDDRVRKSYLGH